jgi:hypothetical protein
MTASSYNPACGDLPPQSAVMTGRAVFTEAYAVIPRGVMSDIVTSLLPFWEGTRAWILSRPLSGFSETFSQYLMEVAPGGGSERPEPDPGAEGVLLVVDGGCVSRSTAPRTACAPAATSIVHPARPGVCAMTGRSRRASIGFARPMSASPASSRPSPSSRSSPTWTRSPCRTPRELGHNTLRIARRSAARHARQHRHLTARRLDSIRRDACDGARPVRVGGQGGLPAQPGLGRSEGRRLTLAARVLPSGLLRGRPRPASLPALKNVNCHAAPTPFRSVR